MRPGKNFRERRSGVLLHPTSLPSAAIDGALGKEAYRFLDFLVDCGFTIWQMLPVNSTDRFGSPYQGTSVHAGNSHLISIKRLVDKGWLTRKNDNVPFNSRTANEARSCFETIATEKDRADYQKFKLKHSSWLDNYALYSAIKTNQNHSPWWTWPEAVRNREAKVMENLKNEYGDLIEDFYFEQYIFFNQWNELASEAKNKGIMLLGDLPILVAHDSVDVWAHPEYFKLDEAGQPTVVAGVPPDYFSDTGQRWGNPLYDWDKLSEHGYRWWVDRIKNQLQLFDMVRIDHFRGFVGLWEIDSHAETAEHGYWTNVPGRDLFHKLRKEIGELPFLAEDLGIITPEVEKLRDDFNFPGMKVLMFAFDSDEKNPYLPHNHKNNCFVYTGTHDNNTTLGWFYNLDEGQQERILEYLQYPAESMPWPIINSALGSVCDTAIVPMQDLLALDGSHRMNTPGTTEGNWLWHFNWEWISPELTLRLRHLNKIYDRI